MMFNPLRMRKKRISINRRGEIYDLKKRAREIQIRLARLNEQIDKIQNHRGSPGLKAVIDPLRCVACGICADNCPLGAIVIEETARIDAGQCKGCGICTGVCPRGAISLRRGWRPEQEKKQEQWDKLRIPFRRCIMNDVSFSDVEGPATEVKYRIQ